MATVSSPFRTLADVMARLGGVSLDRVLARPAPSHLAGPPGRSQSGGGNPEPRKHSRGDEGKTPRLLFRRGGRGLGNRSGATDPHRLRFAGDGNDTHGAGNVDRGSRPAGLF